MSIPFLLKKNSLSRPIRNKGIRPLQKNHNIFKLRLDVFQVVYVCVPTCLAVFSCEARSAMTKIFLARISSAACSVVKARITGTEVLAKI